MNKESRNAFMVIGAVLVGLLVISLLFSGRPGDAVIGDAPDAHGEVGEEAEVVEMGAPAAGEDGEAPVASQEIGGEDEGGSADEITEVTGLAPDSDAATEDAAAGEATAEEFTAEEGAAEEGAPAPADGEDAAAAGDGEAEVQEVALAGDPEAGERVFRQCQACHAIGEGAENRVGPQLTGVVGRPIASVEGFTYSDSLLAVGQEGRDWTHDELRGFLANPREYVPGTAMAYAGVRSEDDLENLITYLATFN